MRGEGSVPSPFGMEDMGVRGSPPPPKELSLPDVRKVAHGRRGEKRSVRLQHRKQLGPYPSRGPLQERIRDKTESSSSGGEETGGVIMSESFRHRVFN